MSGRSRKSVSLMPLSEEAAKRIGFIFGEMSAAAKALAEFNRRRAAGEDVRLYRGDSMIVVGPPLPEDPA